MAALYSYPFEWLGKSRASLPKVKSGCMTCKKRRVKCDEGKPTCSRCRKGNRSCAYQSEHVNVSKETSLQIQLCYSAPRSPPVLKFFSCEAERCGFASFRQIPPEVLGEGLGWRDLNNVILQNSETDSALRNTVIALGTMHEVALRKLRAGPGSNNENLLALAFKHYQQAIQLLRNQLQHDQTQSLEASMLSCVLLSMFDFMQGDDRAAVAHLFGGIAMLRQYLAEAKVSDPLIDRISSPWRTSLDRSGVIPTEGKFGAMMLLTYGYLDFWSHYWMDSQPALPEVSVMEGLAVKRKPEIDSELNTAFQSFSALENRVREFLRAARGRSKQPHCGCANFVAIKAELARLLVEWNHGYARICCSGLFMEEQQVRATRVVAVNHKKIETMLLAAREDGTMNYLASTPAFEEVLAMSVRVLEGKEFPVTSPYYNNSPFAFMFGVIHPLYITAVNCEDPSVCQKAIDALCSRYRIEGVWDSYAMANMAQRKLLERRNISSKSTTPCHDRPR